jgi:aminomethyltransferase
MNIEKRQQMTNTVKDILITKLNLDKTADEIPNDTVLFGSGLGLDSIDALQLVVGIEAELNVTLPQSQFAILRSVNTIVDYILESKEKPSLENPSFQFNSETLSLKEGYENVRSHFALTVRDDLAVYKLSGLDALENLNKTISGKIEFLADNTALQTLLLNEDGKIDTYLEVINCGEHYLLLSAKNKAQSLKKISQTFTGDIAIEKLTNLSIVAIDGPNAASVIEEVFGPDVIGMTPNMLVQAQQFNIEFNILRTNPTGEIGYLLFFSDMPVENFLQQAEHLLGKALPICQLSVHQLLRLEACTFEETHFVPNCEHPLEAGLQWMIDIKKEAFIGKEALTQKQATGIDKRLVPFYLAEQETSVKPNEKIKLNGKEAGYVAVSTYSPSLGKTIGFAYVNSDLAWPGISLELAAAPESKILLTSAPFFLTKSHFVNI